MGICKLCKQEKKLVKAHVIPNSFYRFVLAEDKYFVIDTNIPERYALKQGTGIYDPELVCECCERTFSPWDNYGKQIILDTNWTACPTIVSRNKTLAYVLNNVDYTRLKLFFLSVTWRISASTRPFFSNINLGPHEESLRSMVIKQDPGESSAFQVTIARFVEDPNSPYDPQQQWLNPQYTRFENVKFLKVWMGGCIIYIKVDQLSGPSKFRDYSLAPNRPLYVIARDFSSSSELSVQRRCVQGKSKQSW